MFDLVETDTLSDPIKDYLPEDIVKRIANADVATIRQLLKHTSGIVDFEENYGMFIDIFNDPSASITLDDVFENYVYGKSAYFGAGEGYHYSNTGYSLLGMIIEKVTGSLGDYFEQEIIIPLGLTNTCYKSSDGYPDSLKLVVNSYFEFHPGELQNCTDLQKNLSKLAMGHEGVVTAPYHFARFIQGLMRGNILDPITVDLMKTDEVDMSKYFARGLGITHYRGDIRIYGESYGHGGESEGTQTQMLYFPDSDVTIVLTCNLVSVIESVNSDRFYPLIDELINVIFTGKREGNE